MMSRSELIQAIVNITNADKKTIEQIIVTLFHHIGDTLAQGKELRLSGFGTLKVADRKARAGRNPRTGEAIRLPRVRPLPLGPQKN